LISTVRPGVIEVFQGSKAEQRFLVVGGFAEVTPERCTVLAEEAMAPTSLDRTAIEAELQVIEGNLPSLREQVARATGTDRDRLAHELRTLEQQQNIARAKLQAVTAAAH
jgi:F-type H+-transporting ATPase subunit epsilon